MTWKPLRPRVVKARRELSGETRGGERDAAEMGDGVLVGAVVVHLPDLFRAAAAVDVVDLGFGDAVEAAAEAEDDLVGEAMGDLAGAVVGGVFAVLLGEDLGKLRVLGVEEEAVDVEVIGGDAKGSEDDHGGVYGGSGPLCEVDVGWAAGGGLATGLGGHGLRDHVKDAGVGEVVKEDGVKGVLEGGGVWRGLLEVGYGEAGAVGGAGGEFELDAALVLGVEESREEKKRNEESEWS